MRSVTELSQFLRVFLPNLKKKLLPDATTKKIRKILLTREYNNE